MSGRKYLLDTNIIIGFLSGEDSMVQFIQATYADDTLFASQITRMELLSFPEITKDEENAVRELHFSNRL